MYRAKFSKNEASTENKTKGKNGMDKSDYLRRKREQKETKQRIQDTRK
jgi:hypothetical protein